jgi:membrane-associated phospholipid phosphatase
MRRPSVLCICIPLTIVSAAFAPCRAQTDTADHAAISIMLSDTRIALDDAGAFFSAPVRFGLQDWLIAGGSAAGIAGLMALDERSQAAFSASGGRKGDFWDVPTLYGETLTGGIAAAGTYAAGLLSGDAELRTTGRLLTEALLLSGSTALAIRMVAGRSRPSDNDGAWEFKGFRWDHYQEAFPSGHAMVAFAMSTVLAERIDHPAARVGLYGLAALTAAARVHDNRHWLSDVAAGAAMGFVAGLHVVRREEEREQGKTTSRGLLILPSPTGLSFVYAF